MMKKRKEEKMKNKKLIIIGGIITCIFIGMILIFYQNRKKEENITEYIPAEEITQEQFRQTTISLYFVSKETKTLIPEARSIDVKEMMKEPYELLVKLLLEGPKNDTLQKTVPEGTKINKVAFQNGIVTIDFSKEFVENHPEGVEEESRTIYSLVNTLTQLNEVEGIKIVIDGEENKEFKDKKLNFKEIFVDRD